MWGANYTYSGSTPFKAANVPSIRYNNAPRDEKKISFDTSAKLILEVPANAKVFVDDKLTNSNSEVRHYYTPSLEYGQTYFYDVRVEFEKNGKVVSESKRVYVRAGEVLHAAFNSTKSPSANIAKN